MSSIFEEVKKEKEVTLDELHERFEKHINEVGYLFHKVIEYVIPYIVEEILKANGDAMTKAQAIFYLGKLYGALKGLSRIQLEFAIAKKGPYEKITNNFRFMLQLTAYRLFAVYNDLKKGQPLDEIRDSLQYFAWDVEFSSYEKDAEAIVKYIEKLKLSRS